MENTYNEFIINPLNRIQKYDLRSGPPKISEEIATVLREMIGMYSELS